MEIRFAETTVCCQHIMQWHNRGNGEMLSCLKTGKLYRIGYVWQGDCTLTLYHPETESWGTEYHLKSGDFWYMPPGVWYRTENSADLKNTNIFFDYKTAGSSLEQQQMTGEYMTLGYRETNLLCPVYQFSDMPLLSDVFVLPDSFGGSVMVQQMCEEWDARYRYGREILDHMTSLLLLHLNRQWTFRSGVGSREAAERAIAYIGEHYREKLNCSQVAAVLGYHPNYLNTVIRETTGVSLHRYILETKLRYARHLVSDTSLSVSEIAAALSFHDASHFTNVYTKYTGMAPTVQRKRNRGDRNQ